MFIPNYSRKPIEGDVVVLKEKLNTIGGLFTIGHKFNVIHSESGVLTLSDEDNNIVYNVNSNKVSVVVNLEEAKTLELNILNKYKKLELIKNNCSNRRSNYEEYQHYYSCNLKHTTDDDCDVKEECEQYCDPKVFRRLKINELRNGI